MQDEGEEILAPHLMPIRMLLGLMKFSPKMLAQRPLSFSFFFLEPALSEDEGAKEKEHKPEYLSTIVTE